MAFYLLQETGDRLTLEDSSGFLLLELADVPGPTLFHQGDGLTRRKRKRRDRTRELFDAIEATLRATLEGDVAPVIPTAFSGTPTAVHPSFEIELARLAQYAREDEDLSRRLEEIQRDIRAYEIRRRAEDVSDDEDSWMLLT